MGTRVWANHGNLIIHVSVCFHKTPHTVGKAKVGGLEDAQGNHSDGVSCLCSGLHWLMRASFAFVFLGAGVRVLENALGMPTHVGENGGRPQHGWETSVGSRMSVARLFGFGFTVLRTRMCAGNQLCWGKRSKVRKQIGELHPRQAKIQRKPVGERPWAGQINLGIYTWAAPTSLGETHLGGPRIS